MAWRNAVVVGGVTASVLALSACGGSLGGGANGSAATGGSGGGAMVAQLTFPAEVDASVGGLVNYNPLAAKPLTTTWLYEPLIVRNNISCQETPWLATKATWEGNNKLTLDIRDGVKWSDGQPFTAKDVAFTFNVGKQYPAADKAGVWTDTFGSKATSVEAKGNQVVLTFGGAAIGKYQGIIETKILPEHIYGPAGDPTKFVDKTGVGTGPYKVESYNGRRLTLVRRDDYWQADKIKVQKLVLEGNFDASQAALKLRSGELDAYWGEIPNPQKTFVEADPKNNHFWYAPNGATVLTGNTTKAPFTDAKFREAISYAMNKDEMSTKATYGIMKPASQSGLKLPFMADLLPSAYAGDNATILPFDVAKANSLLDAAGYKKGANGKRTNPDGSPLSLSFTVQAGFIDFQALADVVVAGLVASGLDAKVTQIAPEAADAAKKSGDFQMLFDFTYGGCDIARGLGAKLSNQNIPTATDIKANVERWNDPASQAIVTKLDQTTDKAEQKALTGQLVDIMMKQFPVTALIYAPSRILYRTDKAIGWPSEQDPYGNPADDKLLIITHLTPPK
jgi:peptide/nickel transport system substrate-binding protein